MAGRPRRTRLYDCNYNIGESYYRPTIDQLDRKMYGKPAASAERTVRPRINVDDFFDEDLKSARRRAEKVIAEDGIFDGKDIKLGKPMPTPNDDFDEEVQSTLNRIRASKKLMTSVDDDLEDSLKTMKRRARIDLGEKLLNTAGDDEVVGGTIRRRALKMVSRASADDSYDAGNLTKWTALTDDSSHSAAQQRAKATKARLADIESEMVDRSERQAARERRVLNMRKVLAESEFESTNQAAKALTYSKAEKKVSF
ncbi:ATP-dependent RNA helicase dbp4 isoform X1 [Sergentomyia squamirostris]